MSLKTPKPGPKLDITVVENWESMIIEKLNWHRAKAKPFKSNLTQKTESEKKKNKEKIHGKKQFSSRLDRRFMRREEREKLMTTILKEPLLRKGIIITQLGKTKRIWEGCTS